MKVADVEFPNLVVTRFTGTGLNEALEMSRAGLHSRTASVGRFGSLDWPSTNDAEAVLAERSRWEAAF